MISYGLNELLKKKKKKTYTSIHVSRFKGFATHILVRIVER